MLGRAMPLALRDHVFYFSKKIYNVIISNIMLNYSEIKRGKIIEYNGEPHKVMANQISKKNRNKPTNQTKLKSLVSGKNFEVTFHAKDKTTEAFMEKKEIKFLYTKNLEVFFCEASNPKNRFSVDIDLVENEIKFLKTNDVVLGEYFKEKLISIIISPKIELVVKTAPDAVKGNTSSGATKKIILENELEIFAPLFVEEGDIVSVNTDTCEYSERRKV